MNINNLFFRDTIVSERVRFVYNLIDLLNIKNICDIGSWHLGQSLEFLEIFPYANIFAFEANPDNYKFCVDRLNSLPPSIQQNIKIYETALSDSNGIIKFYPEISTNAGASSKYKFIDGLTEKYFNKTWIQSSGIDVRSQTLDDWMLSNQVDHIDMIWMDVQGGELDVLKGASECLKNVRCIFTEVGLKPYYEGQSLKREIDALLLSDDQFIEVKDSFQYNGSDAEANTIYVNKKFLIHKS